MNIQGYIKKHFFSYLKRSYPMLIIILVIDLIPLFGILYLGWGTMDSLYLYFFETLIICAITYLKMRKAKTILAFAPWQKRLGKQATSYTGKVGTMATNVTKRRFTPIRMLISFIFLTLNIPLCLLLMMIILSLEGKGFSLSAVFGYNGGHTDLFVMSVNTFYIMIALLVGEHFYNYRAKYLKNQEYEKAGMINEVLAFEFRMIIQSIVMVGGVAMIFFFDASKVMVIILIIFKTLIDLFLYLRNRYWSNVVAWIEAGMDKAGVTE